MQPRVLKSEEHTNESYEKNQEEYTKRAKPLLECFQKLVMANLVTGLSIYDPATVSEAFLKKAAKEAVADKLKDPQSPFDKLD